MTVTKIDPFLFLPCLFHPRLNSSYQLSTTPSILSKRNEIFGHRDATLAVDPNSRLLTADSLAHWLLFVDDWLGSETESCKVLGVLHRSPESFMTLIHSQPPTGARPSPGVQAYFDRTAHRHLLETASVGTKLERRAFCEL
jgi:hypothetical protein